MSWYTMSCVNGIATIPFQEIADQEQLATLQAVLNEICMAVGIAPESPESDDAAGLLLHLHGSAAARLTS